MQFPARLMIIGSLVQIPLSGVLMLGGLGLPGLGLKGSAVAVILVAAGSSLVLIWRLLKPGRAIRLTLQACRLRLAYFADILRVGALASLSPVSTVLTIAILNTLIGRFGVETLAGYGIVARVEFLLVPLVFGIGAALTALVGVNMGAGQVARAERIGWIGGGAAAGLAGVIGLVLAVAPGLWTGLFTRDPASLAAGALYLHIVGPVFAFQGLGLALYFASQGAGAVLWPIIATLLRFGICVGGAALVMGQPQPQLGAVYACIALGMAVYGVVSAVALWRGAWRRRAA
jgi:Na+-driven multidrug efflux pump